MNVVFHDADFQAAHVRGGMNFPVGGHVAKAVFRIGQDLKIFALQSLGDLLADLSIQNFKGFFTRFEQERRVEQVQIAVSGC